VIAAVGLRLVFIRPDLELDHHLRHRQTSAMVLMVSSLLAIAISSSTQRWRCGRLPRILPSR
jgi:hypothetical protein